MHGRNQYQLLDSLPANATEMALPSYHINFKQLFCWRKFQAFAWIKFFYIAAIILIVLFYFIDIIYEFTQSPLRGVVALIFSPVLAIITIAGFRILAEVLLTVLMIPHQLVQVSQEIGQLRMSMPARMSEIRVTESIPNDMDPQTA